MAINFLSTTQLAGLIFIFIVVIFIFLVFLSLLARKNMN